MMVEFANFESFKCLCDVEVDFGRLTVLVGPNASGKTSILQGLDLLTRVVADAAAAIAQGSTDQAIREKLLKETFAGDWALDSICSRNCDGLVRLARRDSSASVNVTATKADLPPENPRERSDWNRLGPWSVRVEYDENKAVSGAWQEFKRGAPTKLLTTTKLLRFDTPRLASPSASGDAVPRVAQDGYGLASMLAFTKLNRPEVFMRIEEGLRAVVPAVSRIRFDRVADSSSSPRPNRGLASFKDRILVDTRQAAGIPANHVSEGTLLALGIISVLSESDEPVCVLLDDIDHAMHPRAQRDLVSVIRRILETLPHVQIIATTHSPYFVDNLSPAEVRLTTLRDDGTTACARLDEHPDFEKWKDEMAPGEFWSSVGEKWVTEREAAGAAP